MRWNATTLREDGCAPIAWMRSSVNCATFWLMLVRLPRERWPTGPPVIRVTGPARGARNAAAVGRDDRGMATFEALPAAAAWHHQGARDGFEVVFFERLEGGIRVAGETTAVEEGEPWWVGY